MSTKRVLTIFVTVLAVSLFASTAFADNFRRGAREQADSDFRIAEKAYRKALKDYGESFSGLPEKKKMSACKKINSALYTNQRNMVAEDIFRQRRLKEQIGKLEQYGSELDCPPLK